MTPEYEHQTPEPEHSRGEAPIAQAATLPTPNDAPSASDEAAFGQPLFDDFATVAARQPDHLAVDDGSAPLSYAELRNKALALGARIAAVVPAGGLVGVAVPTNAHYPVAWLACFAARRAFVALDPTCRRRATRRSSPRPGSPPQSSHPAWRIWQHGCPPACRASR